MRGLGFFILYLMMDEFMDDLNVQLDEVFECLIILDGLFYFILCEFVDNMKIFDEVGCWDCMIFECLEIFVVGYCYLVDFY